MHYHSVEMSLYEIALNDEVASLRYGMYPFARLNMLYSCMNATRRYFDAVGSLSLAEWFDLPYTIWAAMGHAIVVLSKLCLINADGWDQAYVQTIIDFPTMIDTLAQKLDGAKVVAESSSEQIGPNVYTRDVSKSFAMFLATLHRCRAAHDKYMAQINRSVSLETTTEDSAKNLFVPDPIAFFEFLEEDFWNQFV